VFRSRGGRDDVWNGVALCAVHHLHGVHLGYLEVAGRAGERLYWRFATGEAFPTEEWETYGEDDVRRAGSAGGRGPPGENGATDVESAAGEAPGATDVEPGPDPDADFVREPAAPRYLGGKEVSHAA
jgi:hypothetical protein